MSQKFGIPEKSDDGVSEVIGELMMLVITVMIFVILIAAVSTVISKPRTEIIHMNAIALSDDSLLIMHTGGDTIAYGQVVVVVNGHQGQYPGSDENHNDRWDLGESLYVSGVDTSQYVSIMVYDSVTNSVLGDFTVDPAATGIPGSTPTPVPSSTPTPSATATTSPTPTSVPVIDHFTMTSSSPVTGARNFTLTVTAYDQYNNVFTGYRGNVYFRSSVNQDDFDYKNYGHSYDFTATDGGVHLFQDCAALAHTGGTHVITLYDQHGSRTTVNIVY